MFQAHLNELQLQVLSHLEGLAHTEDVADDVLRGISQVPQVRQDLGAP